MIDLHCHILPALDDGALDLADSVAMAREAERDGISVVCATPHIRADHDVRIDELPARISALQSELDRRRIAVRIAQGGEIAQFAADGLGSEQLSRLTLDGGGWILLEAAPGPIAGELIELVQRLSDRGVRAIIAHPERHAGADFERWLRQLTTHGCLIQWTADFLLRTNPDDPDDLVLRLAREGLVHLLASDAHSSHGGRPLRLSPAFQRLREVCPSELVDWIAEQAPAAVLRGEPVQTPV